MRRFVKILTAGLTLLSAFLLIALVVVINLDFNDYRENIAEQVSKATGRSFAIEGDLLVDLSFSPVIQASDIVMGNADWSASPEMLRIKSLFVKLDLLSLIFKPIRIHDIRISGVDLLLETAPSGLANYEFSPSGQQNVSPDFAREKTDQISDVVAIDADIPIFRQIAFEDIRIAYVDGVTANTRKLIIRDITLSGDEAREPMLLTIEAQGPGGVTAVVNGVLGSPESMFDPQTPWPVDLFGDLAGIALDVSGSIMDPVAGAGVDLHFAAEGPEISDVAKFFLLDMPAFGKIRLEGQFSGDFGKTMGVKGLNLEMGSMELARITALGAIGDVVALDDVDIQLALKGREIGKLSGLVEKYSGHKIPKFGPVDFRARFKGGLARAVAIESMSLTLGHPDFLHVTADGTVADLTRLAGARLNLKLDSAKISRLNPLLNRYGIAAIPAAGPLKFKASFAAEKSDKFVLNDIGAKIGKSDLTGALSYDATGAYPFIRARLTSNLLRKKDFAVPDKKQTRAASSAAGFGFSGNPNGTPAKAQYVISDAPFDLGPLKRVDGNFDIQVKNLEIGMARLKNMALLAKLKKGRLEIDNFEISDRNGIPAKLRFLLDSNLEIPLYQANLTSDGFGIETLITSAGMPDFLSGPVKLDLNLTARGRSLRELASNLDGKASLFLQDGQVNSRKARKYFGAETDLLLDLVVGPADEGVQEIYCFAFVHEVNKGVINAKANILDTPISTISSTGDINLGKEILNLTVTPHRTIAGLPTAVPVSVGGSFQNPRFLPDPVGTVLNLGKSLWGETVNVITLKGFEGFGQNLQGENSPCVNFRPAMQQKHPSAQEDFPEALEEQPEKIIKNLLQGIFQN